MIHVAPLRQQDPARPRQPRGEAVGELELGLEVVRQAQHDHVRRRRLIELGITR